MRNYDDYIVFLLGADDFKISKLIRKKAEELGDMFGAYELSITIAQKFEEYSEKYFMYDISTYEVFANYLEDYEKEIVDFIESDGVNCFEIRSKQ
jgi:hypothetical protein